MNPLIINEMAESATSTAIPLPGANLSGPLLERVTNNPEVISFFSSANILDILNALWLGYTVLAYLFCIFLLVLYVYASTGKKQLEEIDAEEREQKERAYEEYYKGGPKNNRLSDVIKHISSDSPNDWKLAIIEADIILDEVLKEAGYQGASLGERLRSISPAQLQSLDAAWQAHKVRNQVAHGGADFILTHKLAQDTIKQYRIVFHEFGLM